VCKNVRRGMDNGNILDTHICDTICASYNMV
jgi:hypothetical protein